MNLVKVYIVQSITTASNNLRLNSQQIEVVGLLRETIMNSENLGDTLFKMKKSTVLSKLAIRLNEVYTFLTQGKVDFLKISEQFREHSRYLIRDLNQFLDNVNPIDYNNAINHINGIEADEIKVELVAKDLNAASLLISESNMLKEEIIMQDDSEDHDSFNNFEDQILSPIKTVDNYLKRLESDKINKEELEKYSSIMEKHSVLASARGFGIISDMHKILFSAFKEINFGSLNINKSVIESLRACLIVIAAVVKGKELDITDYLNKAEEFGKKYFESKNQVLDK
ncbi:MAG: hypothetical protein KJN64_13445 [Ignavibacteria bacterium]|nr:hypothetical protein [Ignavibacteria bacterium]MBT8393180.1 hypothetical protein [Ignavibacteria bacterium]NNJ53789.1 hypothetical protein [Ignavibacteriaceae bacterium]NNL21264.1 hypothetical protein [Ignavibacteriaceae bacterium]